MTLIAFLYVAFDRFRTWKHNPEATRALMLSAFAVDLSIVAFALTWGVIQ